MRDDRELRPPLQDLPIQARRLGRYAAAAIVLAGCTAGPAMTNEEESVVSSSDMSAAKTCLVPGPLKAFFSGEQAFAFKSVKSASAPYLDPTACEGASFKPDLISGGRMTSVQYRQSDAAVGDPEQEEVGMGTLCFRIQDPTFTAFGMPLLAYGKLTLSGISLTLDGQCMVTNHDMPTAGVHQMTCGLPVVNPPPGYAGGLLTTNSVLNVAGVPGLSSGSILALHLYTK